MILDNNTELTVDLDLIPKSQRIEGIIIDGIEGIPNPILEGKKKFDEYEKEEQDEVEKARILLENLSKPRDDTQLHV